MFLLRATCGLPASTEGRRSVSLCHPVVHCLVPGQLCGLREGRMDTAGVGFSEPQPINPDPGATNLTSLLTGFLLEGFTHTLTPFLWPWLCHWARTVNHFVVVLGIKRGPHTGGARTLPPSQVLSPESVI